MLGLAPSEITFPEEDTEEVNVSNLPTVYRAIWETARKHDIDDADHQAHRRACMPTTST